MNILVADLGRVMRNVLPLLRLAPSLTLVIRDSFHVSRKEHLRLMSIRDRSTLGFGLGTVRHTVSTTRIKQSLV